MKGPESPNVISRRDAINPTFYSDRNPHKNHEDPTNNFFSNTERINRTLRNVARQELAVDMLGDTYISFGNHVIDYWHMRKIEANSDFDRIAGEIPHRYIRSSREFSYVNSYLYGQGTKPEDIDQNDENLLRLKKEGIGAWSLDGMSTISRVEGVGRNYPNIIAPALVGAASIAALLNEARTIKPDQEITRRDFLKTGTITAGGVLLLGLSTRYPEVNHVFEQAMEGIGVEEYPIGTPDVLIVDTRNKIMALNYWAMLDKTTSGQTNETNTYVFAGGGHVRMKDEMMKGPEELERELTEFIKNLWKKGFPDLKDKLMRMGESEDDANFQVGLAKLYLGMLFTEPFDVNNVETDESKEYSRFSAATILLRTYHKMAQHNPELKEELILLSARAVNDQLDGQRSYDVTLAESTLPAEDLIVTTHALPIEVKLTNGYIANEVAELNGMYLPIYKVQKQVGNVDVFEEQSLLFFPNSSFREYRKVRYTRIATGKAESEIRELIEDVKDLLGSEKDIYSVAILPDGSNVRTALTTNEGEKALWNRYTQNNPDATVDVYLPDYNDVLKTTKDGREQIQTPIYIIVRE